MRCFYHTEREAVAVCRMCARGLCAECGQPIGRALACRGECAEWGRDYEGLMDEAVRNYRRRTQQQKELDEKKKQSAETPAKSGELIVRNPGPTMRERAETFHMTKVAPPPSGFTSWRWNHGVFQLLIGLALVIWGVIHLDDSLFILIVGLVSIGSGLYFIGFNRGRRRP